MRDLFDRAYIDEEFKRIGASLVSPVNAYLIGGCAMSFRGLKEATKDVDVVLENEAAHQAFTGALYGARFKLVTQVENEYKGLHAMDVFRNKDGMTIDIFVKTVLHKLSLSKGITGRAEKLGEYGKLSVFLVSKEDVFLFKCLASETRVRDLSDMEVLYPNLNWETIRSEIENQKLPEDLRALVGRRLAAFSTQYKLDIPEL